VTSGDVTEAAAHLAAPKRANFGTLAALLRYRAAAQPDDPAYVELSDRGQEVARISFAELARRSADLAHRIAARAEPGDRALLACPNGIGFMVGFFGCVLSRVAAVPIMAPRRNSARDASAAIVADCTPRLALAPRGLIDGERGDLRTRLTPATRDGAGIEFLAVDEAAETGGAKTAPAAMPADRDPGPDDLAFLQYTSGSTSAPKGVMVSHANLLANLAMIARAFGTTASSTYVSWVPLYHDMGLIINALQSLYVGAACVLMTPVAFVQRPLVWLRAIGDYRAEVAGGPNFAFDLCVERYRPEQMEGIDLSGWKVAFNGAEPVRAESIRRFCDTYARHGFAASAMLPAYGLAEATVLVSAGGRGAGAVTRSVSRERLRAGHIAPPQNRADVQSLVGCGRAIGDERIAIVDPDSAIPLAAGEIGEIWVAGPNVARGYWRNPEASAATFGATMAGDSGGRWLRTGDLGFLDESGELYITGRLKDIIIIRGANHYPQDIENTVQQAHPALRPHGGAAFAVPDETGAERLVVVQEIERTWRQRIDIAATVARIREAVVAGHEIVPDDIALLRPGALPKTTSGKIQRALSRRLWQQGSLDRL
jgi:acyl-CoA synthetase (AMP-forming)/AMP-acid ligase II